MMAARSSIASLKNTLEKSLGFSNRDEFLVPGEEVDPGDDALVVEVVVANQGKSKGKLLQIRNFRFKYL